MNTSVKLTVKYQNLQQSYCLHIVQPILHRYEALDELTISMGQIDLFSDSTLVLDNEQLAGAELWQAQAQLASSLILSEFESLNSRFCSNEELPIIICGFSTIQ